MMEGNARFQIPRLVSGIFDNYIGLVVLELSQREEDDISLVDPDLASR
jgi:hypothetical protein